MGTAQRYYEACEGSWSAHLALTITDPRQLCEAYGWSMAVSWRMLAHLPGLRLHTSVVVEGPASVRHTTRITWGPLTMMRGTEDLILDGPKVQMAGESRSLAGQRFGVEGHGEVNETSSGAHYQLRFMGAGLEQTAELEGNRVTLRQMGPGFHSCAALDRQ